MTKDLLDKIRHYCAYQERCHKDVRTKLLNLSFSGEDLEEVISLLISEDFLNEERFARSYCRGKFNQNNWGKQKIIQHLKQKEVSEYCIRKGIEEINEEKYQQLFDKLFQKKWESLAPEKNHWIKRRKILDYLTTKGFATEMIYEKLKGH